MKTLLTLCFVCFSLLYLSAQSPIGKWDTYDDETGEKKSVIEIYKKGDQLYGKIIKIYDKAKTMQSARLALVTKKINRS